MDCSPPGSSVHRISQARILEWVPFHSPGNLPDPRVKPRSLVLWASLVAQLVKNPPAMRETWSDPWVGKIPSSRERPPTPVSWPGESHGLYGVAESGTTERLSLSLSPALQAYSLLIELPGNQE